MELLYKQNYTVSDMHTDCFGRAKPSAMLYISQQIAGEHCLLLGTDWDTLQKKGLFWALIRTKVQITRLPALGQQLTVRTWPMPQTRTAYPRCTVACDRDGQEYFRVISLWVLMDTDSRAMVLPGKSQIQVPGILTGDEPELPRALPAADGGAHAVRTVGFAELDRNLHMNNTRYLDWVMDLADSQFHQSHPVKEFTVCYLSEAREGQQIHLDYTLNQTHLVVDGHRSQTDVHQKSQRIFAVRLDF